VAQWGTPERAVDFFDLKGELEALLSPRRATFEPATHPALHPGRCARVRLAGQDIGIVGELHPRWRQAYELPQAPVLFELDLTAVQQAAVPAFVSVPRQQSAWRDVALVLGGEATHAALQSCLEADPQGLVRSATLFDIYRPAAVAMADSASARLAPGERSMAYRLELRDDAATLTDEKIDAAVAAAVGRAGSAFSARLRA
jgi:phenylalanyl-tRNA synthetase beta chain